MSRRLGLVALLAAMLLVALGRASHAGYPAAYPVGPVPSSSTALTGTYPGPGINVGAGAPVTGQLPLANLAPGASGQALQTVGATATWVTLGTPPSPPTNGSWSVTAWYLDLTSGSDSNTGLTSGSPFKTIGHLASLWGTWAPRFQVAVTVHVVGAHTDNSDSATFDPTCANGGSLTVVGTPTSVATGTISSLTAKSRGTPGQLLTLTLPGSPAKGMLVTNTTRGSSALVWGVSGSVATMATPLSAVNAEDDTWSNGDSVTVQTFPSVALLSAKSTGQAYTCLVVSQLTLLSPDGVGNDNTQIGGGTFLTHVYSNRSVQLQPSGGAIGPALCDVGIEGQVYGGAAAAAGVSTVSLVGGFLDGYTTLSGGFFGDDIQLENNPTYATLGGSYFANTYLRGTVAIQGGSSYIAASSMIWGGSSSYLSVRDGASLSWNNTATATSSLQVNAMDLDQSLAYAIDYSTIPPQMTSFRTLTSANIDASVASGGFGDCARGQNRSSMCNYLPGNTTQAAYVAPTANGGTSLGTLTAHAVVLGNGTGAVHFAAPGVAGTYPRSLGTTSDPAFSAINAADLPTITATGDAAGAGSGGSIPLTFASVNSSIGTYGDASHVGQITLNAKGLATLDSAVSIAIANANLTAGTYTNITGTGTLTAGSLGAGYTLNFGLPTLSGTVPLTNQAAPTSTGFVHVTAGAWDSAARTLLAADLPTVTLAGDVSCSGSGGSLTGCNVTAISGSTPINITPATLQWLNSVTAATITEAAPTSDVATSNLTISPQPPYASASTNKVTGNVIVNFAGNVAGYNANLNSFTLETNGTNFLQFTPNGGAGGAYILYGSTLNVQGSSTMAFRSTGGGVTFAGTPVTFQSSGNTFPLTLTPAAAYTIVFPNTVTTSIITSQTALASTSTAGAATAGVNQTTTAQAGQANTNGGAGANGGAGGNVVLNAGTGGTASGSGTAGSNGQVVIQDNGSSIAEFGTSVNSTNGDNVTFPNAFVLNGASTLGLRGTALNLSPTVHVGRALGNTDLTISTGVTSGLTWDNTVTTGVVITQGALASTSSASGTAGVPITETAQAGQAATGASHNGGAGGALSFVGGAGGTSASATPGVGGAVNVTAGASALGTGGDATFGSGAGNGTAQNGAVHLQTGGTDRIAISAGGSLTASAYSTGLAHFGSAGLVSSSLVSLTADVTGTLGAGNGGTGLTAIPAWTVSTAGTFTCPATGVFFARGYGGGGGGGNGSVGNTLGGSSTAPVPSGAAGAGSVMSTQAIACTATHTITVTAGAGGSTAAPGGQSTVADGATTLFTWVGGGNGANGTASSGGNTACAIGGPPAAYSGFSGETSVIVFPTSPGQGGGGGCNGLGSTLTGIQTNGTSGADSSGCLLSTGCTGGAAGTAQPSVATYAGGLGGGGGGAGPNGVGATGGIGGTASATVGGAGGPGNNAGSGTGGGGGGGGSGGCAGTTAGAGGIGGSGGSGSVTVAFDPF